MAKQVTLQLHQLRVLAESDTRGGSEPYLWVTYFVVDGRNIARPEPVTTFTPVYDAFRTEFPDNVRAGRVIPIPPFIARFSVAIDPGPLNIMMAGCVAVALEEDESPDAAMRAGRNAYVEEIHVQLNNLFRKRIATNDRQGVTDAEIKVIRDAVEAKVRAAVKSNLSTLQKIFGNQDDTLGFTHVAFLDGEIRSRSFDFPEVSDASGSNRLVLSGSLTVGPVLPTPVDLCARQRAAVKAKQDEIKGLQTRKSLLQAQLQTAPPQAKGAIIDQITEVSGQITSAEAELGPLLKALQACEDRFQGQFEHAPVGLSPSIK